MATGLEETPLKRVLGLPLLVFYGLGVTIGAGIFALVGEVLAVAGDRAPLAFLVAALIAGATGVTYAILVRLFPRAGGVAVYVNHGLGKAIGFIAGLGVIVTGIVSSATISLSFSGYVAAIVPVSQPLMVFVILAVLAGVACWGVRESVLFAAVITILELSTLLLVAVFGLPEFVTFANVERAFSPPTDTALMAPVFAASLLAFFAFIGFEDIINMAEETREPNRVLPRAIFWTLVITSLVYLAISLVAVSVPDRDMVAGSGAPMKALFELVTGLPGEPVAAMAAIAMINGILVQMVMVSRMMYGMAGERQLPAVLARVHPTTKTPVIATLLVATIILILALAFPLVRLAQMTSYVTLSVFAIVNFALFAIGRNTADHLAGKMRWWGILAGTMCLLVLAGQFLSLAAG